MLKPQGGIVMRPQDAAEDLLPTSAAGYRLKVTGARVLQLVAEGTLPVAMRTPLGRLFRRSDVEALAARRAAKRRKAVRHREAESPKKPEGTR